MKKHIFRALFKLGFALIKIALKQCTDIKIATIRGELFWYTAYNGDDNLTSNEQIEKKIETNQERKR